MKNSLFLFISIVLLGLGVHAKNDLCQVDDSLFESDLQSNSAFNIARARANFAKRCDNMCQGEPLCFSEGLASDDVRSAFHAQMQQTKISEHCESLGALGLVKLGEMLKEKNDSQIQSERTAFDQSTAPYISRDPVSIQKNIERYAHLNAISEMRLRLLKQIDLSQFGTQLKISKRLWTFIYTNFQVEDLSIQVGTCKLRWSGANDNPQLSED